MNDMSSPELAHLLHRALEPRLARLLAFTSRENWSEDPESLHQARIASRRVRTVLDLVDPAHYVDFRRHAKRLRQLTHALGETRELDVHLAILEHMKEDDPNPVHETVIEFVQEHIDRKDRKTRSGLEDDLKHLSIAELSGLIDDAILPAASNAFPAREALEKLDPLLRPVEDGLGAHLEREDASALHAFRIHLKCLRYALELFEDGFPIPLADGLARLKEMQTALGDHHDFSTLEALLWKLRDNLAQRRRPMLAIGVLDLIGITAEARRADYDRFRKLGQQLSMDGCFQPIREALASAIQDEQP